MSLALLSLTLGLTAVGLVEARQHRRRLATLPVRVHVNGTRGKSSVTRLIAAGLRAAGRRVVAKSTGTLPCLVLPDGTETAIERRGRPNIAEQLRVVRAAHALRADALVVECMAVQPELQWLAEEKLIRATCGVITNVRPDHLDVMGPSETHVAQALAGTVPYRGHLFTCETTQLEPLRRACAARQTTLHCIAPELPAELLRGFRHREHAANVALALAVCAHHGVDRENALAGMWRASPDPGALTEHELRYFNKRLVFVNGFAANDPTSTAEIWNETLARHRDAEARIAVFNCRKDRIRRSEQLGLAYATWPQAEHAILTGRGTHAFANAAVRAGVPRTQLVVAENAAPHEIVELVLAHCEASAVVVGMGNIAGAGMALTQWFANRSASAARLPWSP